MTDREMLEMAAKAAGHHFRDDDKPTGTGMMIYDYGIRAARYWDPLTDDGDALRLAVKLRLTVDLTDCHCCVTVYANQLEGDGPDARVRYSPDFNDCETTDPAAATRLAILRAAAQIGKEMP